ncbi:hypothetical protein ACOMHN_010251 [Nucella lapillus]
MMMMMMMMVMVMVMICVIEAWNLTVYEGLWGNCNLPIPVLPPRQHVHSRVCLLLDGKDWQKAVIGLMLLAATLSLLGCLLSSCGLCASVLPRRVYYLHSAGELFCVCALSTGVALTLFTVAVRMDLQAHYLHHHPHHPPPRHPYPHPHHLQQQQQQGEEEEEEEDDPHYRLSFGTGYFLGWGGALSCLLAALLLSLDNLVQELARAKCCRKYCLRAPCWDLPPGPNTPATSPPAVPGGGATGGRDTELRML